MTIQVDDFVMGFSQLSNTGKAGFMARISHMETVHIRDFYYRSAPDVSAMLRSSELIHRLSGYTWEVLSQVADADQDRSVAEMILTAVQPRGDGASAKLKTWLKEAAAL